MHSSRVQNFVEKDSLLNLLVSVVVVPCMYVTWLIRVVLLSGCIWVGLSRNINEFCRFITHWFLIFLVCLFILKLHQVIYPWFVVAVDYIFCLLLFLHFYLSILSLYFLFSSCIKKGYMKDDYIHLFVKRPIRRSPIINRGMICLPTEIKASLLLYMWFLYLNFLTLYSSFPNAFEYYLWNFKVILHVGLLSVSFYISFWIVNTVTEAFQRSRYCLLELALIQPSLICRL